MARLASAAVLSLSAFFTLPAWADDDATAQPRWQARLQLSSLDAGSDPTPRFNGSRVLSANLLGDYYLTSSGISGLRGGLRLDRVVVDVASGDNHVLPRRLGRAQRLAQRAARLTRRVDAGERRLRDAPQRGGHLLACLLALGARLGLGVPVGLDDQGIRAVPRQRHVDGAAGGPACRRACAARGRRGARAAVVVIAAGRQDQGSRDRNGQLVPDLTRD